MVNVSRKSLIGKLEPSVFECLDQAAHLCRSMRNYDIELEHLFLKLAEVERNDLAKIFSHFRVETSRFKSEVTAAAERLKRGSTRDAPGISRHIPRLLESAWLYGSIEQGATSIRSGALCYALLADNDLLRVSLEMTREFNKIDIDELHSHFAEITAGSIEGSGAAPAGAPPARTALAPRHGGKALERYTIDLTAQAKAGQIDPVLGRDDEIRLMIDILMRRRQNNPILTGEPGVGKTAVVEGFALRLAKGDVPDVFKKTVVRTLDLGLLQAGAGVRGEFESRLKGVIEEVKQSPVPIILFIDEAHTLIGAGKAEGASDAANLLKPALARGELRTIAATTWDEYKDFEKDAALARRFQVVRIEEPTVDAAMVMLRGLTDVMERHHNVRVLPGALDAAVKLGDRYLADRQLPDKAVSVLDTASARVALGQGATPPALEAVTRRIEDLEVEQRILKREAATGEDHAERLAEIETGLAAERGQLDELTARWEQEKELVQRVIKARDRLDPSRGEGEDPEAEQVREELRATERALADLQGEEPLMRACVDEQAAAEVISAWTGVPLGRMVTDEIETLLNLESLLRERVVGQDHALEAIAQRIRTSRSNLSDPQQPLGVFLLVGPSGVGKSETALTLADLLYGGERNVVSINMSEYQESSSVSNLKGSAKGLVGYGEGGALTEAVRRTPYSVVLLDETEKAHPDVMELFYQVFDKGTLEDSRGRVIDFKNTIILCTSNLATDKIVAACADPDTLPDADALAHAIHDDVVKHFKPALVGRMRVIPYYPLRADVMRRIVGLKMDKIARRLLEHHGAKLDVAPEAVDAILARCTESDTGARNIDRILTGTVMPELSNLILQSIVSGESFDRVAVGVNDERGFQYELHAS